MRNFNSFKREAAIAFGVIAATGGLAIAGCNGDSNKAETSSSTSTAPREKVSLTFDDLGGGSSVIRVFPGVENSSSDHIEDGTFDDGDKWDAVCDTEGRTVQSDPSVGEMKRSSDQWFKLAHFPGSPDKHYATAVYVEQPQQVLDQLKPC